MADDDQPPGKMTITGYSDPKFSNQINMSPNPFPVWINPSTYKRQRSVSYTDPQAAGSSGGSPKFNRVPSETVSFELIFDATGVVPRGPGVSYGYGVSPAIAQLLKLTATVTSTSHSPNYLLIKWAQLQFKCVMTSMAITYTLFRPDGTPLRAKAALDFCSFNTEAQLAKLSSLQSPDMTHLVTVVAGDTLPLLCHRIYGDSGYYLKVAEANGLIDFRRLQPGSQLVFPPLSGSA